MSEGMKNYIVFRAAGDIVTLFSGALTEDEKNAAFGLVCDRLRDAVTELELHSERMRRRLKPLPN